MFRHVHQGVADVTGSSPDREGLSVRIERGAEQARGSIPHDEPHETSRGRSIIGIIIAAPGAVLFTAGTAHSLTFRDPLSLFPAISCAEAVVRLSEAYRYEAPLEKANL